jgi:hypothetical protein
MLPSTLAAPHLSRLCAGLFLVSTLFPVVAGVYPSDPPRWLGIADVGFAAVLLTAAISLAMQMQNRVSDGDRLEAFRLSQIVLSAIPILLALFFITGSRIKWDVLVIGLAWRAWLLLYTLPSLIAGYRQRT